MLVVAAAVTAWDGAPPRVVAGMFAALPMASSVAFPYPALLCGAGVAGAVGTFVVAYGLEELLRSVRPHVRPAVHGLTVCLVAVGDGVIAMAIVRRLVLGESGWGAGSREDGWQFVAGVSVATLLLLAARRVDRRRAWAATAELAIPIDETGAPSPTVRLASGTTVRLEGAPAGMTEPVLVASAAVDADSTYRGDARRSVTQWMRAGALRLLEERSAKLWLFALFALVWLAWPVMGSMMQGLRIAL